MLETRTRLKAAMPAFLRDSSKLVNFSLCVPLPLVRKISLAIKWVNSFFLRQFLMIYMNRRDDAKPRRIPGSFSPIR